MKIVVERMLENQISLLRRAGYTFQRKDGEETSFVRVLSQSGYPRFHIYSTQSGARLSISLHLDVKKHTYGDHTRHHGEYENEGVVREEGLRLQKIFGEGTELQ